MRYLMFVFLFASITAGAHSRRHHDAHVHGAGKLAIAFDGVNGKMDLRIPSESIFGFESTAKTKKQKAAQKSGISTLEQKIASLVVFDSAFGCIITADKVEVVKGKGSTHSDTIAAYSVKCAKSPIGSVITFNFQNEFPKIKDLDIEVVADNMQKSLKVKSAGTQLELK